MKSSLKCNHPDHQNSRIINVCIDPNCDQTRWACLGCRLVLHNNHKVITLKEFASFAADRNNMLNTLRINLANIQKKIKSADDCLRRIKLLNETYFQQSSLEQLNIEINNLILFEKNEQQLIKTSEEVFHMAQTFAKQFCQISDLWIQIPTQEEQTQQIKFGQTLTHQFSERQLSKTSMSKTIYRQLSQNASEIQNPQLPQPQRLKIRFTKNINKNLGVETLSNGKQAKGQGLIFCEPELQENSFTSFCFRMINGYDFGIGIGSKTILENSQFRFDLSKTGHGLYFMSGRGSTYSNHDQKQNNVKIKNLHEQLKIIQMEVNLDLRYVRWLDESNKEIQKLSIKLLDSFHVVAEVLGVVEIIDL